MKNLPDNQIDWAKWGGSLQELKVGSLDIEVLVIKGAQNLLTLYRERSAVEQALASEFAEDVPGIEYYKKAAEQLDHLIEISEIRQEELNRILTVTRLIIRTEEEIPLDKRSLKNQTEPTQYPFQYSNEYSKPTKSTKRRTRKKKTEE